MMCLSERRPHRYKGVNEIAGMMVSITGKREKQAVFADFEHARRFSKMPPPMRKDRHGRIFAASMTG